jgi:AraC-like DNA-binding protein
VHTELVLVPTRSQPVGEIRRLHVARLGPAHVDVDSIFWVTVLALGRLDVRGLGTLATSAPRSRGDADHDTTPRLVVQLQLADSLLMEQALRFAELPSRALVDRGPRSDPYETPRGSAQLPASSTLAGCWPLRRPGWLPLAVGPDWHLFVSEPARPLSSLEVDVTVGRGQRTTNQSSVTTQQKATESSREVQRPCHTGTDALQTRIREYVRQRLNDPELSARTIAQAHHISVRYLYKVLASCDLSLGDWIRSQRLEQCRHDLTITGTERETIAAVAHRAGFGDLTHFARSFKKAYGLSPREYRAAARLRLETTAPATGTLP